MPLVVWWKIPRRPIPYTNEGGAVLEGWPLRLSISRYYFFMQLRFFCTKLASSTGHHNDGTVSSPARHTSSPLAPDRNIMQWAVAIGGSNSALKNSVYDGAQLLVE